MKRVFISSSLVDLRNWRRAAERAVEGSGSSAVRLERLWPERPASRRTLDLAGRVAMEVRKADAFIRIVAARKGARVDGSDRTFLDQAFESARDAHSPVFLCAHPEVPLFTRFRAGEATQPDLTAFSDSAAFAAVSSPEEQFLRVIARGENGSAQH